MNDVNLKQHLFKLETNLLNPEIRQSANELNKFLADDFFEFGSSGNIWYKSDSVNGRGISIRKMTLSNFEIHPLSSESVLTTYRVNDETRKQLTLRSSIWKKLDGDWKMYFHQGTITNNY